MQSKYFKCVNFYKTIKSHLLGNIFIHKCIRQIQSINVIDKLNRKQKELFKT